MPRKDYTRRTKPSTQKQEFFDISTLLDGLTTPRFIRITADQSIPGLQANDLVLIDCGHKRPRDGDFVCWGNLDAPGAAIYSRDYEYPNMIGIGVAVIRKGRFAKIKNDQKPEDRQAETLRRKLDRLERVPENEAERFRLESEIYRLENQTDVDEWPEVIEV